MMLRNSGKIFSSNFSVVYKLLLYKFIVGLLLIALAAAIFLPNLTPVWNDLKELGVVDMAKEAFDSVLSLSTSNEEIKLLVADITDMTKTVLGYHSSHLMRSYIGIAVIILLAYFFSRMADIPVAVLLHAYTQYQARFSFASECIGKFVKSLRYSLLTLCIMLPIDVAIIALSLCILIGIGGAFVYFSGFFAVLVFIVLFSLRLTFFSVWLPCMVAEERGVFDAFKESLSVLADRFARIFSECILIVVLSMCLFSLVAVSTLGAALPLYLVALTVFYQSFGFVAYFGVKGKRYYVDYETIVTPKKLRDKELNFKYDMGE